MIDRTDEQLADAPAFVYRDMSDEELLERAFRLRHTFPRNCLLYELVTRFAMYVHRGDTPVNERQDG